MVLEFMSLGSLFDYLHDKSQDIDWSVKLALADDIARGMDFLHQNEMIHRGNSDSHYTIPLPYYPIAVRTLVV
jgi:serine/threonine protein kinase